MNATSRSNSGTSHGADSRRISDRSICSSPLPGGDGDGDNGDQVMSSQYTAEPSLGVYFEKHDHEYNDVIAAFRVSKRIIEETIQKLDQNLPYHKQIKQEIKGHEHEFTQWIFTGCGIASKKKISVKTLPLFRPLATYVRTLQDITSDLPEPGSRQSSMRNLVRRISSTASSTINSSSSSPPKDTSQSMGGDRRLASRTRKLTDSFQSLREHVNEFKTSEEKEAASRRLAETARKESGISQELCLPGTRTAILGEIISLLESSVPTQSESEPKPSAQPLSDDATSPPNSETRVICLVGEEGEGKSSVAATVACDMKRKGKLGGILFITDAKSKPKSDSDSSSNSSSNTNSNSKRHSQFLSFIRPRRRQSQNSDQSARSGSKAHLNTLSNILDKIPTNGSSEGSKEGKSDRMVVVVDGLEHVSSGDADSLLKKVAESVSSRPSLRVLVTSRSREPSWMAHFTPSNSVKVLTLSPEPPSYMLPVQSSPEEIEENEGLQLSKRNQRTPRSSTLLSQATQPKRAYTSSSSNPNANADADDDVLKYVSSRFCLDLSPSQQRLLADAAEANFRTIVRLCDELEESGVTERGLDIVIYRELQRKHPGRVKVILA